MGNIKDVFNAFLVEGAEFTEKYEFAKLRGFNAEPPNNLIPFDKAKRSKKHNCWVHFYLYDEYFMRIWRNPKRYLPMLKKFAGVISPDFSLYWDMPLCQQIESVAHGRALAHWYEKNGISVIPNVRWGDERTYEFCFDGIPKNTTVAVGSHGCLQDLVTRNYFIDGLSVMLERLEPTSIVVYGYTPKDIFESVESKGIKVSQFDNQIVSSRGKEAK
ncbi:MAG: DUF4417 domain-containing protein [Planctomycetia bacterium]|nr:DUF4417 domain-containing protein [Planctomycetia bacterium]